MTPQGQKDPDALTGDRADTLPVTVVIPAFNSALTVGAAVRSVLDQSRGRPAEVLVIDDGSTDDTAARASEAGGTVISHGVNRGLAAARNTGLSRAQHSWVALLDADDAWFPDHLGSVWPHRHGHVVVANAAVYYREGHPPRWSGVLGEPRVLTSPSELMLENLVPAGGAILQRDTVLRLGGFRSELGVLEDFDLWLRLLEQGTILLLRHAGLRYTVHDFQMSNDGWLMHRARLRVIDAYADRPWWSRTLRERWIGMSIWDMSRLEWSRGQRRAAARRMTGLALHPQRPVGLAMMCVRRFRLFCYSARIRSQLEPFRNDTAALPRRSKGAGNPPDADQPPIVAERPRAH